MKPMTLVIDKFFSSNNQTCCRSFSVLQKENLSITFSDRQAFVIDNIKLMSVNVDNRKLSMRKTHRQYLVSRLSTTYSLNKETY